MLDLVETQARIDLGIELLNEKRPGWQDAIDWDYLDVRSTEDCILAQTFGEYMDGKYALGIEDRGGWEFGFDAPTGMGTDENYAQLADMWRESAGM